MKMKTILAIAILFASTCAVAADADEGLLMVQVSPANGGTVAPGAGLHRMSYDSSVPLTATPSPGYRFITWLGDVGDATSNATTTYLDTPKIIVAVFARSEYEFEAGALMNNENSSVNGRSGLRGRGPSVGSGGGISPARGGRPRRFSFPDFDLPDNGDIPVPEEVDADIPVPENGEEIPEPATLFIMTLGGVMLLKKRNTHA